MAWGFLPRKASPKCRGGWALLILEGITLAQSVRAPFDVASIGSHNGRAILTCPDGTVHLSNLMHVCVRLAWKSEEWAPRLPCMVNGAADDSCFLSAGSAVGVLQFFYISRGKGNLVLSLSPLPSSAIALKLLQSPPLPPPIPCLRPQALAFASGTPCLQAFTA
jgi:hypothetical protein